MSAEVKDNWDSRVADAFCYADETCDYLTEALKMATVIKARLRSGRPLTADERARLTRQARGVGEQLGFAREAAATTLGAVDDCD